RGVAVGELEEVLHAGLTVRPEEAVEAEDERDRGVRTQLAEGGELLGGVLGRARRLRTGAELAGLGPGGDAEPEARAGLLGDGVGGALAGAGLVASGLGGGGRGRRHQRCG